MEVDRLIRMAHSNAIVPLPILVRPLQRGACNWEIPAVAGVPMTDAIAQAVADVQSRCDLRDPAPVVKSTCGIEELQRMLMSRISKLPEYTTPLPRIGLEDFELVQPERQRRANWTIPRILERRNARQDVVAVIYGLQRQFDMTIG